MTTTNRTSHPIALRDATVTDPFWASRQELVRTQVIPYQWNALNDNVPGAAPSYCMHNFKAAAAQNAEHRTPQGRQGLRAAEIHVPRLRSPAG
nr:hypothetical protein [Bifidobacterium adolescentis]